MIVATTVLAALACALGLRLTGTVHVAAAATAIARSALADLNDAALDDAARERAARAASGRLFRATGALLVRGGAAAALFAAPVWAAQTWGIARWHDVSAFLMSWPGVLVTALAGALAFLPRRRP